MQLTTLLSPHRFSSILITPPPHATWSQIQSLPIRLISAEQSFVFLWVGRGDQDGLERGRELLVKWGFRRCEDIVWVQTNRKRMRGGAASGDDVGTGLMIPMKEHCLMGIRGTVRRSTDPWLIHANVDTDVLVWDGPDENGEFTPCPEKMSTQTPKKKGLINDQTPSIVDPEAPTHPPQLYDVIENFCLGTRRLELFVPRSRVRRGWVGIGCTELGVDAAKPASVKSQPPQISPSLATPESSRAVVADLEAQAEGMELADTLAMEGHQVEDFDSERYAVYISRLRDGMGRYVLPHRDGGPGRFPQLLFLSAGK
jgi:mRNA (2'-O-methyladenosine-N6-)-methyltransferase